MRIATENFNPIHGQNDTSLSILGEPKFDEESILRWNRTGRITGYIQSPWACTAFWWSSTSHSVLVYYQWFNGGKISIECLESFLLSSHPKIRNFILIPSIPSSTTTKNWTLPLCWNFHLEIKNHQMAWRTQWPPPHRGDEGSMPSWFYYDGHDRSPKCDDISPNLMILHDFYIWYLMTKNIEDVKLTSWAYVTITSIVKN